MKIGDELYRWVGGEHSETHLVRCKVIAFAAPHAFSPVAVQDEGSLVMTWCVGRYLMTPEQAEKTLTIQMLRQLGYQE